jgi:glycosyltransferase involved in cell wall biosynthesis
MQWINYLYLKCVGLKFRLIGFPLVLIISYVKIIIDKFEFIIDKSSTKISILNGTKRLQKVINSLQPDLIHALEFQHSAYLLNSMRKKIIGHKLSCKVAISNWGSDIEFFKNDYRHVELIAEVLSKVDYLFVECDRDAGYAVNNFRYQGVIFKVINSVGIDFDTLPNIGESINNSDRRIIMVKGYESVFGRASLAFQALEDCANSLRIKNYRVLSYSTTEKSREIISKINKKGLINIEILPRLANLELLQLFAKTQIYIGVGISDGISISSIEAMAAGAIPIQTDTSCCNEWFIDGLGGFIIPASAEHVKRSVLKIIEGDFDGDGAATINYNKVFSDANYQINSKNILNCYAEIFNEYIAP